MNGPVQYLLLVIWIALLVVAFSTLIWCVAEFGWWWCSVLDRLKERVLGWFQ